MKLIYKLVFVIVISLILSTSCHKDNTSFDYNKALETTGNYVEAQQTINLLLNTYFKSITDSLLLNDSVSYIDGANITYSSNPPKIVIAYPWCIYDGYGHTRYGQIEATSQTGFFNTLDIVNIDFKNFNYDNNPMSVSSFSITNKGLTNANNYTFDILATNIQIDKIDTVNNITYKIAYELQQTFVLIKDPISAYSTSNDYFNISGSISGTGQNEYAFNTTISDTNVLINSYSCNWLKGGIANIELPDFIYNATADYNNNSTCVNKYSVVINEDLFIKAFDGKLTVCGQ